MFKEHLRICDDCWSAWFAWRSLEADGAARPGDEEIAVRAADRALRGLRRETPRARRTARVAAAAILLTATMASAGVYQYHRRATRPGDAPPPQTFSASATRPKPTAVARPPVATPEAEPRAMVAPPAAAPRAARLALRSQPAVEPAPFEAPTSATSTAGALFAEATDLRRDGRLAEAMAAFRRLQMNFSETPEATVSLVSLAEMLADGSTPAAALPFFDAYLTSAPQGPLVPEALMGKARVLDHLGRTDEARSVRREVGRRPAGSLYAPWR
jgi:TolA-binding protein